MERKVKISDIDFLIFDFDGAKTHCGEFPLECTFNLSSQSPNDETLLKRAILVDFRSESQQEQFRLNVLCRVVFTFLSKDDLTDGKELIELYKNDAITAMLKKLNNVLAAMGKKTLEAPASFNF